MLLDGVQPVRDTFHNLIVGTMKGSRLQDAFYFRDQMREMGLQPDVRPLSSSHAFSYPMPIPIFSSVERIRLMASFFAG